MNKSPFHDQAESHFFSDWLLAFAFDFGLSPEASYPAGALPDLKPTITRQKTKARVDLSHLAKRNPLPLGELLESRMRHCHFFDLGCGDPDISVVPLVLCQFFQASSYTGVDIQHIKSAQDRSGSLQIEYQQRDLLEFLKDLKPKDRSIFYFGGIDPVSNDCFEYLRSVRKELYRLCSGEDIVILGAGSTGFGFDEPPAVFETIYTDTFHEMSKPRG